jgi:hypothetical protein
LHESDADRLQALYALEERGGLSERQLEAARILSRRAAAQKLLAAFYAIAGCEHRFEKAFQPLWPSLTMIGKDDPGMRLLGYCGGLQALLDAPEATEDAIRWLKDELLTSAPDFFAAVRRLARDMEASDADA